MMSRSKTPHLEILNGQLQKRDAFSIGDSISARAISLKANTIYQIELCADEKPLFTNDVMSNAEGDVLPTVLWAQLGLDDPSSERCFTIEEALRQWSNVCFTASLIHCEELLTSTQFHLDPESNDTIVLTTTKEGRLLNGFEFGRAPVHLTLHNLPSAFSTYRVMMVPRQQEWRVRNPLELATFASGEAALREIDIRPKTRTQTILFAENENVRPGAYDFIIRPILYGHEDNDAHYILERDILPAHTITGLVVREDFWTAKPVLGGCVNKLPISGRSVSGAPYFRYANTFEVGEDVWGALDPGIVDPGNSSKMCAFYVIPSKTASQWDTNNSLQHLPVLGGNASVQKFKVQTGCINQNKRLLWPNATQIGEYDIVADFGNNVSDASSFVQDDAYDTPLDIIDGYFVAGFRVVKDPGTMQDFTHAGNWNYTETTQGTVSVQDENTDYHTPGAFSNVNVNVNRRANVFFPADVAGVTNPSQISAAQTNYPIIVIVHGNGHDYTTYDFLLEHFAKNGFIAASIHLNGGMRGLGRANMLFHHLGILNATFGTKAQNNIGIMGHSRGGEAVLKAARLNDQLALGHNFNAIIALGPTDQYGSEVLGGSYATPYFVLYGSRDGDITGGIWTNGYTVPQTGFAQYDRANGETKTMAFVYKASHNGFITDNHDGPWDGEPLTNFIAISAQKAISKAYMNAFFRQHLLGESIWNGIFTGEWQPASVEQTGAELYMQYKDPNAKVVDNFEGGVSNWQSSTIGGTVTDNGTLPVAPSEGKLHDHSSAAGLDDNSPHDSKGLLFRWNNANDELVFSIPAAHKNVSSYKAVSFRVTQREASAHNTANQPQKLRVALKDGSNNEREIRVSTVSTIPYPDQRVNATHRKSAMHTVRLPLTSYTVVCAGQAKVDLTDIVSISFKCKSNPTGEIEIDSIEFTN